MKHCVKAWRCLSFHTKLCSSLACWTTGRCIKLSILLLGYVTLAKLLSNLPTAHSASTYKIACLIILLFMVYRRVLSAVPGTWSGLSQCSVMMKRRNREGLSMINDTVLFSALGLLHCGRVCLLQLKGGWVTSQMSTPPGVSCATHTLYSFLGCHFQEEQQLLGLCHHLFPITPHNPV